MKVTDYNSNIDHYTLDVSSQEYSYFINVLECVLEEINSSGGMDGMLASVMEDDFVASCLGTLVNEYREESN